MTPEQLAQIRERDEATDGDEMGHVSKDRRALLKDREAIAERLRAELASPIQNIELRTPAEVEAIYRAFLSGLLNDMGVRDE